MPTFFDSRWFGCPDWSDGIRPHRSHWNGGPLCSSLRAASTSPGCFPDPNVMWLAVVRGDVTSEFAVTVAH